ncbi:hypothetical protein SteCoe_6284 [Stentor coeruleus]|uniref:protein-tyrosine-phosphatase n=1 Tax=Stentor coeruleus TaxID=5963 RepID=A0A1R2CQF3_9CILI|nr:hypothetical protein SteCoe_6284 [Stentor coeruleus]
MNPLLNLQDPTTLNFQYIYNLLQRYKDRLKFIDLRDSISYENFHLPISLHICQDPNSSLNINLKLLTKEKELSRLRRYCIIISFTEEYETLAYSLMDLLTDLKCKEINLLPLANDFFRRYSFLSDYRIQKKDLPNEIIPGFLYLGSQQHAHNRDIIEILGITHVLNVTIGAANPFPGLKYCRVHVDDNESEKISVYFQKAYDFIDNALESNIQGKKTVVLVHCAKGVSRSATIVIMYMMRAVGFSLNEAFAFIQKQREIIGPNAGFIKELEEFEKNNTEFNLKLGRRSSYY